MIQQFIYPYSPPLNNQTVFQINKIQFQQSFQQQVIEPITSLYNTQQHPCYLLHYSVHPFLRILQYMQPSHQNLTQRHIIPNDKTHRTIATIIPSSQQLFSTRHSHRKFKLSHSQLSQASHEDANPLQKQKLQDSKGIRKRKISESIIMSISGKNQYHPTFKDQYLKQSQTLRPNIQHQSLTQSHKQPQKPKKDFTVTKESIIKLNEGQHEVHIMLVTFKVCDQQQKGEECKKSKKWGNSSTVNNQNIEVLCLQISSLSMMHCRVQHSYVTLPQEFKMFFSSLEQIYDFILDGQKQKGIVTFNQKQLLLQLSIKYNIRSCHQSNTAQLNQKQKILKLKVLPFIGYQKHQNQVHSSQHEQNRLNRQNQELKEQLTESTKQLSEVKLQLSELKRQLQTSRMQYNALRAQNTQLKQSLINKNEQLEHQHRQLEQSQHQLLQTLSQKSSAPPEYLFELHPDQKSPNFSNFAYNPKTSTLTKTKNDLKWDAVSSESPLPAASRHYFTSRLELSTPDFMVGIVTSKGKNVVNAFLGLEVVCLYASKNGCWIYERGRHYKVPGIVKKRDTLITIVDKDKGVIEWVKKRHLLQVDSTNKQSESQLIDEQLIKDLNPLSSSTLTTQTLTTSNNPTSTKPHRKSSDHIPMTRSAIIISEPSLNYPKQHSHQQLEYIHSVKIPIQFLSHEIYAYLQVYNINQPIKFNEKK